MKERMGERARDGKRTKDGENDGRKVKRKKSENSGREGER